MQAGDTIGLRRGRYVLGAPLGRSSYGSIWAAEGPAGGVALKLVNREQMARATPGLRERWVECARNEIAFLGSLSAWDGRHIVRLLDCGEPDGMPAMALERMDTDLARHTAAAAPARLPQILGWMAQANQALARVHQYGWRYLDLKPSNLLLDARSDTVRLADFGTCLPVSRQPHDYAGTASWQAPEQAIAASHGRYDTCAQTDYFALGALFYYLVTGGIQLRFCRECAQAHSLHRERAGPALLARYPAGIATLDDVEASLFLDRVRAQLARRCRADAGQALALLRSLIAARPVDRPRNALDISRALGALQSLTGAGRTGSWRLPGLAVRWAR